MRRNSNIEMLRIFAMFLIVLSHYSYHGLGTENLAYGANRYFAVFFCNGGIGNAVFFLISGYYMCTQRFTLRKLIRLAGEIWFYSLTIYAAFYMIIAFRNSEP